MSEDFEPSRLGTKEHWDDAYKLELQNFEDDSGDEGEIWFGIESMEKMVDWAVQNVPVESSPYILDIGCGNGAMSVSLAQAGYNTEYILGVDYSNDSVKLARSVASHKGHQDLKFETNDFLSEATPRLEGQGLEASCWDLLLDKGTYDAIALATTLKDGTRPIDNYPFRVSRLLKPGGFFLITSCNFTEQELKEHFASEKNLIYHSRIQHKTFTFGGKTGSVCSSVAFQRKQ